MALKAIYDKKEDIPETYLDLYTERDGKWELTGVEGVKTQADVDRLSEAIRKEREDHKKTKDRLDAFHEDTPESIEELRQKNERLEAQVAAGKGGEIDEEKLQEMADRIAQTKAAPIERELTRIKRENETLTGENGELKDSIRKTRIETAVRKAAEDEKVVGTAIDDAVLMAGGLFELTDDGEIVMRDQVDFTPGISVADWLKGDMKEKRPHWWPVSKGGGATGDGGISGLHDNPWSKDNWNLTAQGEYLKKHGTEKAQKAAEAAGVRFGATKPAEKAA